jgi:hypothetical protein
MNILHTHTHTHTLPTSINFNILKFNKSKYTWCTIMQIKYSCINDNINLFNIILITITLIYINFYFIYTS